MLVLVLQRLGVPVAGVYRHLYRHCSEPLEPWLQSIALLGLGFVKPSTFTEAHEHASLHKHTDVGEI
jgi:hypothetical protein